MEFNSKTTTSVTVTWSNNLATTRVSSWRILHTPKGTSNWINRTESNSITNLENLTPGQTYTIHVYSRSDSSENQAPLEGEVTISEYAFKYINKIF